MRPRRSREWSRSGQNATKAEHSTEASRRSGGAPRLGRGQGCTSRRGRGSVALMRQRVTTATHQPSPSELPRATVPIRCCHYIPVQLWPWCAVKSIRLHKYSMSKPTVAEVSMSDWNKYRSWVYLFLRLELGQVRTAVKRSRSWRLKPYETAADPMVAANARHSPSVRPHPIRVVFKARFSPGAWGVP